MEENIQNLNATSEAVRGSTPNDTSEPEKKKFLKSKWLLLSSIILALIIISAGASYFFLNSKSQVACTQEAKLCPDGSSVGRTGPKCEFAKCPTATPTPTISSLPNLSAEENAMWKTYNFSDLEINLKLPPNMNEYQVGGPGRPDESRYFSTSNTFGSDPKKVDIEIGYWTMNQTYDDLVSYYIEHNKRRNSYDEKLIIDGRECLFTANSDPTGQGSLNPPLIDTYNYFVDCASKENKQYSFVFTSRNHKAELLFKKILSTFKFTDQTSPTPTCKPRPACLDATPRCMIPETEDMCPPTIQ